MPRARPALLALGVLFASAACGDDASNGETPPPETATIETRAVHGGIPSGGAGCAAYCEKSNACAEAEGRAVPPQARDCDASCTAGGLHAAAPAAAYACAEQACGPAFRSCNLRAMMGHMRAAEVDVFPPICDGLCNKIARCAERTGQAVPDWASDCRAACAPGGALAGLSEGELGCVHATCGAPFERCRAAGGLDAPEGSSLPTGVEVAREPQRELQHAPRP